MTIGILDAAPAIGELASAASLQLSIVVPMYNEAECVAPLMARLREVLAAYGRSYEVILVDDGSRDGTTQAILAAEQADERVRGVFLARNYGQSTAMQAGFDAARGDAVVTMDSDLQHPPAVILEMLTEWRAGHDVVLTVRRDNKSLGLVKKLAVPVFYKALRYCSGMDVRPAAADFRLMSRKALDALLRMPERHRFIRGMVHWLGFETSEVNFLAPPRFKGKSKFTLVRMIRLARDGLLSFSRVPLHAALLFAGAMMMLSFLGTTGAWMAFHPDGSTGWLILALILGAHLAGGAAWIALLAFSEYLARIHEQVLGRPLYVVRESSADLRGSEATFSLNSRESRMEVA